MDGWMVGPSPTRCWLRPDADDDDDADANERNMRRHPSLPPPLLAPRPPSPPPLARYRLSSRPSRSPERIRRLRGEQGARKGTNENRTIYPADYSPPLPSSPPRRYRAGSSFHAGSGSDDTYPPPRLCESLRRLAFHSISRRVTSRYAKQRESLSIEIRPFHPENPVWNKYIYICIA